MTPDGAGADRFNTLCTRCYCVLCCVSHHLLTSSSCPLPSWSRSVGNKPSRQTKIPHCPQIGQTPHLPCFPHSWASGIRSQVSGAGGHPGSLGSESGPQGLSKRSRASAEGDESPACRGCHRWGLGFPRAAVGGRGDAPLCPRTPSPVRVNDDTAGVQTRCCENQ